jgi:hypothetical protein
VRDGERLAIDTGGLLLFLGEGRYFIDFFIALPRDRRDTAELAQPLNESLCTGYQRPSESPKSNVRQRCCRDAAKEHLEIQAEGHRSGLDSAGWNLVGALFALQS